MALIKLSKIRLSLLVACCGVIISHHALAQEAESVPESPAELRIEAQTALDEIQSFVDVMATMSDPSIPLTTPEWEQWGNPNQQIHFDNIIKYCPYSNIKKAIYFAIGFP